MTVPSEDSDQPGTWTSGQSDQSLFLTQLVANDPSFLHADSETSDQTADLSLRLAHMPFYWFCHEVAHLFSVYGLKE